MERSNRFPSIHHLRYVEMMQSYSCFKCTNEMYDAYLVWPFGTCSVEYLSIFKKCSSKVWMDLKLNLRALDARLRHSEKLAPPLTEPRV